MHHDSKYSIKYVDEGQIRSGERYLICVVYTSENLYLYFYGHPVLAESGMLIRNEIKILAEFRKIKEIATRRIILDRVRTFIYEDVIKRHPNISFEEIDAEIFEIKNVV